MGRVAAWFPRRRLSRWIIGAVIVLAGLVVLLMTVPLDGRAGSPVHLELHAGTIEANNNRSRAVSSTAGEHSRLAASHIVLMETSDHPLLGRAAGLLAERLEQLAFVDRVDLRDTEMSVDGGRLPDVHLLLDMPECSISGFMPTGRTIDAEISLSGGPRLWNSHRYYSSNSTPPVLQFQLDATLDHHSVTTGAETAAARYKLAAENIAEQLAESVDEVFAEWAHEYGTLPDLPEAFYGATLEPPDDLPLPDTVTWQRHYSGPQLMVHHASAWSARTDTPRDLIVELHERFETAGWNVGDAVLDGEHQPPFVRASQSGATVQIFQARSDRQEDEPARVVVAYRRPFNRSETQAAIDTLMVDPLPIHTLQMFTRMMSSAQLDRFYAAIDSDTTHDVRLLTNLARHHHRNGRGEQAMAILMRLVAMEGLAEEATRSKLEELGQKLNDEQWQLPELTEDDLAAAGFQRLDDEGELTVERQPGEPLLFYRPLPDGPSRHAVRVDPSHIPEGVFTLAYQTPNNSGYVTPHNTERPWSSKTAYSADSDRISFEGEELAPDRFRLRVRHERTHQ